MTRRCWLLPLVLLVPAAALAQVPHLAVRIKNPPFYAPVFGEVDFEAEIDTAEPIAKIDFIVDGSLVRTLDAPPWAVKVNVGQHNDEHTFKIIAHGTEGGVGTEEFTTPAIRVNAEVGVELRQLYVTVTEGDQRVLDLTRDDFEVRDAGRPEKLVTFERGDVPLTAVLLLDSSESMKGARLAGAVDAAQTFVRSMKPLDEAKLILFSDRVLRATPFTSEPQVLADSLAGVEAGGGTALNDHLYLALKQLDRRQGRRVVILLSDGADVLSVLSMKDVLWKARRSQALVYWVLLGGEKRDRDRSFSSAWRDAAANSEELATLERTVRESGGRTERAAKIEDLGPVLQEILSELRDQYVLGYYPTQPLKDESWREVKVRVRRSGVDVRTRDGYVDN
jgi:Ca-activated chloride channel homolog